MQMKSAISALARSSRIRIEFPKATAIAAAIASVKFPEAEVSLPNLPDLDEIADRIRATLRSGQPLSLDDFRHAPSCLWSGKRPLDHDRDIANRYLNSVRQSGGRTAFRRLAAAYILRYPTEAVCFQRASTVLGELAQKFHGPWSIAHKVLYLFDPERAPKLVAAAALYKRIPTAQVMTEHGLRVPCGVGLAEAAFVEGLRQIAQQRMSVDERLATIKFWAAGRPIELRHDNSRGTVADALLLPYADVMPEKRDRDRLLSFLLDKFDDPRQRPQYWTAMPRASRIARKWLIEQSLRQFLDVVSHSIEDPVGALQWQYRRAFWTAVYDRQLITDACVIFDDDGARVAERVFEGKTPYAKWRRAARYTQRKQILRGQACLLLRIGPGVVAEWSHNGRCNMWRDAHDPTAPHLHQEDYSSDEVQAVSGYAPVESSKLAVMHSSPATYSWQSKVANVIGELTGVTIFTSEYALR